KSASISTAGPSGKPESSFPARAYGFGRPRRPSCSVPERGPDRSTSLSFAGRQSFGNLNRLTKLGNFRPVAHLCGTGRSRGGDVTDAGEAAVGWVGQASANYSTDGRNVCPEGNS